MAWIMALVVFGALVIFVLAGCDVLSGGWGIASMVVIIPFVIYCLVKGIKKAF